MLWAWLILSMVSPICAQQETGPIEEQIPESLAYEEDILVLAERLRNLRLSEGRLGEAHPAMKSIRAQIKTLERDLRQRIAEETGEEVEGAGKKLPAVEPRRRVDRNDGNAPSRAVKPPSMGERAADGNRGRENSSAPNASSKWSDELISRWGARIKQLDLQSSTSYVWREAFPQLRWHHLQRVGAFPAMGVLWGIETVDDAQTSCIWRWQDHEIARRKSVILEVQGRIHDMEFDQEFERNGFAYLVTTTNRSSDGFLPIDIWRYTFDPAPPFAIKPDSALRVASGTTKMDAALDLRHGSQGAWLLELGESSSLQCQIPGCRAFETRPGVWRWSVEAVGAEQAPSNRASKGKDGVMPEEPASRSMKAPVWKVTFGQDQIELMDLEGGSANRSLPNPYGIEEVLGMIALPTSSQDQIAIMAIDRRGGRAIEIFGDASNLGTRVSTLTSRDMTAIGIDSNGQLLAVESGRTPFRLARPTRIENALDMPMRLSESGWYSSLVDGTLESGFVKLYEANDVEGHGVHHEVWCCLPRGGRIEYDSFGPWRFPDGALILQTLFDAPRSAAQDSGGSKQPKRFVPMQTRVLVQKDGQWFPFAYQWEEDGLDAVLVGEDDDIFVVREQAKCNRCHVGTGDSYLVGISKRLRDKVAATKDAKSLFDILVSNGMVRNRKVDLGAKAPYVETASDVVSSLEIATREVPLEQEQAAALQWFEGRLQSDVLEAWFKHTVSESGRFRGPLDAEWEPVDDNRNPIAYQAAMVFTFACGYDATREDRYLSASIAAAEYLLKNARDVTHGGFYESLDAAGQPLDKRKLLSTNATVMLALAKLSQVSGRRDFLEAATETWGVLRVRMEHSVGGYYAEGSQDFQTVAGCSTLALLDLSESLWGMASASRSKQIAEDADRLMAFVFSKLRVANGFIPRDFEDDWQTPRVVDQAAELELADQLRWAFLASEAYRLGGSHEPLGAASRLLDLVETHGLDDSKRGVGSFENRWKKGIWQQAEFLRTLTRFACGHHRASAWTILAPTQRFVTDECLDTTRGGWMPKGGRESNLRLAPIHEARMYLEGLHWQTQWPLESKVDVERKGYSQPIRTPETGPDRSP